MKIANPLFDHATITVAPIDFNKFNGVVLPVEVEIETDEPIITEVALRIFAKHLELKFASMNNLNESDVIYTIDAKYSQFFVEK